MAKLKAYELQDQGRDTVEANEELGFAADCRGYELPAEALKLLGVKRGPPDDEQPREGGGAGVGRNHGDGARVGRGRAAGELRRLPQDQAGKDGAHCGWSRKWRSPSTRKHALVESRDPITNGIPRIGESGRCQNPRGVVGFCA